MDYVSEKNIRSFDNYKDNKVGIKDGYDARKYAFAPGNYWAKYLACTRNTAIIIGSNIFVHGGLVPDLLDMYHKNIDELNIAVRHWLLGKISEHNISKVLNSKDISPFWVRLLGTDTPDIEGYCANILPKIQTYLGVSGMIIGHTPQRFINGKGINSICDEKIWRVDQGNARAFDPFLNGRDHFPVQVLEIIDDRKFNIISFGEQRIKKKYPKINNIIDDIYYLFPPDVANFRKYFLNIH